MAPSFGLEGGILIRLNIRQGRVADAVVESARPIAAAAVLEGRPVAEALALVGPLFTVCGTAQGLAGLHAWEDAQGLAPSGRQRAARELLLLAETAREHAWRLCVDWPRLAGLEPDMATLAALCRPLRALATATQGLDTQIDAFVRCQDDFLAAPPIHTLATGEVGSFRRWFRESRSLAARLPALVEERGWGGLGASRLPMIPVLDRAQLARRLAQDASRRFCGAPDWDGSPRETGPLARQADHPLIRALVQAQGPALLARLAARLVEWWALADRMRACLQEGEADDGPSPIGEVSTQAPSGQGLGIVETARGTLVHWLEVAAGRITAYRIVAPTEWNFHPQGALVQGLVGMEDDAGLEARVALAVAALDPCVGWRMEREYGERQVAHA